MCVNGFFRSILLLLLLILPACSPVASNVEDSGDVNFEERFGIEVVALRTSAAGHMLDFRYRVVDLDKAMLFFREDIKPYVVDQKTGKSLTVPVPAKLGPMRPTGRNPKLGITYWMFFGNPGLIKSGDLITLVVGDYQLENLMVE